MQFLQKMENQSKEISDRKRKNPEDIKKTRSMSIVEQVPWDELELLRE